MHNIDLNKQQRAGLLFLSKSSSRILLILDDNKWTVPTFNRNSNVLTDAAELLTMYSTGKIIPIELYISADKGFEYSTYVCLVDNDFLTSAVTSYAWCNISNLPTQLHHGLKHTLTNQIIKTKIETILQLETLLYVDN